MFLDITQKRNPNLIKAAFYLHQNGFIQPDTYVIDLDHLMDNARHIKAAADQNGISLYFMSKQLGRNPLVCKALVDAGYAGAVTVDFREALTLIDQGIPLGHVGHLVQIPTHGIEKILQARPEVITVYSVEKAKQISDVACRLGLVQNIMLRVLDAGDTLYPEQYGGFYLEELAEKARLIESLPNIHIHGVTSFPCFLYDERKGSICPTHNVETLLKAQTILESSLSISLKQLNMPSASCAANMAAIALQGGTHAEPGHGLTGTTPYHAYQEGVEIPCIAYVSEISHQLKEASFCYGGGHYRRSHMEQALVGSSFETALKVKTLSPDVESIDYYMTLQTAANVGDTVVMSYRTQIFVTRSHVAVVAGIKENKPKLLGIFDSQGREVK